MLYFIFALAGMIYGSFLTAAIPRVASNRSLWGRSQCAICQRLLTIVDLVPIFSFIFLKGRCRTCKNKIGLSVILTEMVLALWGLTTVWLFSYNLYAAIFIFLIGGILLAIAVTDWQTGLIPWPWLIAGGLLAVVYWLPELQSNSHLIVELVLAALIGGSWFAWQYFFSRGRWVGLGDVYLGILLGLIHGSLWPLIINLEIAYIVGALYAIIILAAKKGHLKSAVPFGPFLILGALISMVVFK